MTEGMQRQSPDDGAIIGESMKTKRVTFDGCRAENANVHEFILVGLSVVEEFLAEKTVEPQDVNVERGQLLPSFSNVVLRQE